MRRMTASISSISSASRPEHGSSISSTLAGALQEAGQQQLAPLERVQAAREGTVGRSQPDQLARVRHGVGRHLRAVGVARRSQSLADAQRRGHERCLERAPEPDPRPPVRRHRRDAALAERDRAVIRARPAREHVEEGGLAGPVGAGKTEDLSGIDRHGDVVQRHEGPVGLADAAAGEGSHLCGTRSAYIHGGFWNCDSMYGAGWMMWCTPLWIWKNRCAWPMPGSGVCAG